MRAAGTWSSISAATRERCAPACGSSARPDLTKDDAGRNLSEMATRGLFIGINRHADPATRELRGARPDAVALHAMMLDAMPSMRATLLTDGDATHARV